eukprot:Hpha_TRINITY_DN14061_c0_g1::TRINITY_DN14061_c0_g1_i1::g.44374::m.44374
MESKAEVGSIEEDKVEGEVRLTVPCAGMVVEVRRKDLEEEDGQDPCFFDPDYSVAAATGFTLWEGGRLLVSLLQGPLGERLEGKRVLELGAGIGLAGLCAAAAGAHVLVTDLPAIVYGVIEPNIARNSAATGGVTCGAWHSFNPIGCRGGSAKGMPLDWNVGVGEQGGDGCCPLEAEVVMAAEVVWLDELIEPFANTAAALVQGGKDVELILVCRNRATAKSASFAPISKAVEAIRSRGVELRELSRHPSAEPQFETVVLSGRAFRGDT